MTADRSSGLAQPKSATAGALQPRRSKASRIAMELGRMARQKIDLFAISRDIDTFFEDHRETIIRAIVPKLQPDGRGGFSALVTVAGSNKLKLLSISEGFTNWSLDGDRDDSVSRLIGALTGYCGFDIALTFLASAAIKGLQGRRS
jgi:hypothetical protein